MTRPTCLLALLALTSGCGLLTKSEPVVPRYFTPEAPERAAATPGRPSSVEVRLGHVGGGSYLKERMAYRNSDHEFGFREDQRWTERPEVYLERAIEQSLFEERGVKRSLSSIAPTLTAELIEFEEVQGPSPHVRLRVSYALHDERTVFFEHSFTVERPLVAGPDASRSARVAAGLGDALRDAVARIADEVVADRSATLDRPR